MCVFMTHKHTHIYSIHMHMCIYTYIYIYIHICISIRLLIYLYCIIIIRVHDCPRWRGPPSGEAWVRQSPGSRAPPSAATGTQEHFLPSGQNLYSLGTRCSAPCSCFCVCSSYDQSSEYEGLERGRLWVLLSKCCLVYANSGVRVI